MAEEKDKSAELADKQEEVKPESTSSADKGQPTEKLQQTPKETKTEESKAEKKEEVKPKFPELKPGMTVRVHQKIREKNPKGEEKKRIQIFEGIIIAKKHGNEAGGTITVRKVSNGIGVEKIFPLNLPTIVKIEPIKQARVSRSKLYYLRRGFKKKLKETLLKK